MNVREERARAVAALTGIDPEPAGWRTHGLIARVVFFVLTCVGIAAFYGLCDIVKAPLPGVITALAAIGSAEILIGRRWFFTGVEEALWLGAMLSLISELPRSGTPESSLVIGAAVGIAGARVRNPLFGTAAVIFATIWAEGRLDMGVLAALLIGAAALLALLRTWLRPSTEWLWIAIALAMPFAGFAHADAEWRNTTVVLYLAYGTLALLLGLKRRHHAFFLASIAAFAIAAIDLLERIDAPAEVKLAVPGLALVALAYALTRALRDRRQGFVVTPEQLTPIDGALEIAATLVVKPPAASTTPPRDEGGSFGGAGASGSL